MRRACFGLSFVAAIALFIAAAPRAAHAQQTSSASPSRVDSLTTALIDLELHRVAMSKEDLARIAWQIDSIHAQLRALPQGTAADREAMTRVILALDARADTLQARLRQARMVLTDEHPEVRRILNENRAINERRAELVRGK